MSAVPVLPNDLILHEILPRLFPSDVFRFKFVSKFWWDTISDPNFIKAHLRSQFELPGTLNLDDSSSTLWYRYKAPHDGCIATYLSHILPNEEELPVFIMTSCDGLAVLSSPYKRAYYILNPITRQYKKLPHPPIILWHCLLVFDDNSKQYRLFGWNHGYMQLIYMFVFNGKNRWQQIFDPESVGIRLRWTPPAVLSGWFYWPGVDIYPVLALNIQTRQFRVIELPTDDIIRGWCMYWDNRLAAVQGSLYLLFIHSNVDYQYYDGGRYCYVLWRLECLDRPHYWTRLYDSKHPDCPCSIECRHTDCSAPGKLIVNKILDNTTSKESAELEYRGITHINSLVWLKNQ